VKSSARKAKTGRKKERPAWIHGSDERRPEKFAYGPLRGNVTQLSQAQWPKLKPSRRRLGTRAEQEKPFIWIREREGRECECWFSEEAMFVSAETAMSKIEKQAGVEQHASDHEAQHE
jgi:hypothetical protein